MAPSPASLLLLSMSLMAGGASALLDCSRVQTDGHQFDFSPLKGPHSIVTSVFHPPRFTNVTYTLDICAPLKRKEGVKKGDECPNGAWVCGIWHHIDVETKTDTLGDIITIAGNVDGGTLDHVVTRLSSSASDKDKGKEGVRLLLQGGNYEKRKQKAVVELLCKPDIEGTEGEVDPDKDLTIPSSSVTSSLAALQPTPTAAAASAVRPRDDGGGDGAKDPGSDGPTQIKKDGAALIWESYGPSEEDPHVDVLKLTWYTKHACEKRSEDTGRDESKSWGVFTWIVILVFLGAAAYLIFGSWLNYNRYGARGWDLLPHGDTIRDIPYLLQDWIRRLVQTLQGGGSRGGYSAV